LLTETDRPLRVVFVLNSFDVGGTELNAIRTAEAFDPARVALSVVAFHPDGPLRARYDALGVPVDVVRLRNLYGIGAIAQAWRCARRLRSRGVDVVHTHDVYCNIWGVLMGRLAGARVLASRRWWKRTPRSGLLTLNRMAYQFAHRVLANTPSVADMLRRDEGLSPEKVVTITNFLEPAAFERRTAAALADARRAFGLPVDVPLVGIVARLAAVKDHATLLRAIARLPSAVRLHAALVGDGPERQTLERLTTELGINARVHFLGELPSRPTAHELFDVSVLCSLSEASPNSVLEAMAVARPVIASRVGGVADILTHEVNGLLVTPGDVDGFAAALTRLTADGALQTRLGAAGREVATAFTAARVMGQLTALYTDLAGGSAR
jgi:glycosyltransferase involved in cell wall biosynthesis